jgi:hypothetical protein
MISSRIAWFGTDKIDLFIPGVYMVEFSRLSSKGVIPGAKLSEISLNIYSMFSPVFAETSWKLSRFWLTQNLEASFYVTYLSIAIVNGNENVVTFDPLDQIYSLGELCELRLLLLFSLLLFRLRYV